MSTLAKAIQLRMITRRAVDLGDDKALRYWNRRADAAYAKLDAEDALKYRDWAFSTLTPEQAAEFGRLFESLASP